MFVIDVSENNGIVDMQAVKRNGAQGVIIRAGYGKNHIDGNFKVNLLNALKAGLKVGVYWYSYALSMEEAQREGEYCRQLIADTGALLELPVFFDFEDADNWKYSNGYDISLPSNQFRNTNICESFIRATHLNCGIYASFNDLKNIDWESLVEKYQIPLWVAQWGQRIDLPAFGWQFTDSFPIDENKFDGSIFRC